MGTSPNDDRLLRSAERARRLALASSSAGFRASSAPIWILVLVFASDRSGTSDLYYATRASTAVDFGAPLPIASVNTAGDELDPYVSDDGCSLYFVMDPVGDPNAGEIFVVRRP